MAVRCWDLLHCNCAHCLVMEVSTRLLKAKSFFLIKERFRLAENLRNARCLQSVFSTESARSS